MKTTRQYLAAVKAKLHITSDYALQKPLDLSKQGVSYLANGGVMSATTAAKVAEILELPPIQVIADAELERGSSPELWKRIRAAAALAGAAIGAALLFHVLHAHGAFDIAMIGVAFPMSGDALTYLTGIHIAQLTLFAGVGVLTLLAAIALARAPRLELTRAL